MDRESQIFIIIWACWVAALIIGLVIITGPAQTEEQVWVPEGAHVVNQIDPAKYIQAQQVEFSGSTVLMEVPYAEFKEKIRRGDIATAMIEDTTNSHVNVYYYSRGDNVLYTSSETYHGTWFRQAQRAELVGDRLIIYEEGFSGQAFIVTIFGGLIGGIFFSLLVCSIGKTAYSWLKEKAARQWNNKIKLNNI
jgi:hypothetical protein